MDIPDLSQMSDPERFTLAEQLAEDMRHSLPSELHANSFTISSKLPFKAASLREVLIHRQSDLADTAMDLYRSNQLVPAFIMTRSLIETTALLHSLHIKTDEFLKTKEEKQYDEFLMRGIFGSRDGTTSKESFNILTAIDRMNREFDGLRGMYDTLCEYTHPNYSGVMGSYSRLDREKHLLQLGKEHHEPPLAFGFAPLIGCMAIFTHHYNELYDLLNQMNELFDGR